MSVVDKTTSKYVLKYLNFSKAYYCLFYMDDVIV